MKISNKSIAILLGVLLVVTAFYALAIFSQQKIVSTGQASGQVTVDIGISTSISLPNATVAFGNITQGSSSDTLDNAPWPFTVQNDGSVKLNLTVYADNLWTDVLGYNPSTKYQFFANKTGEAGAGWCFDGNASASNLTWTDMPPSAGGLLGLLDNPDGCDSAEIELKITAPADETSGTKSSSVTVTAAQG